jgi:hypothetical protein
VRHAGLWIGGNFLGGRFWIVSVIQAQNMAVAQVDHHVAFGENLSFFDNAAISALDVEIVGDLGIRDEGDGVALALRAGACGNDFSASPPLVSPAGVLPTDAPSLRRPPICDTSRSISRSQSANKSIHYRAANAYASALLGTTSSTRTGTTVT